MAFTMDEFQWGALLAWLLTFLLFPCLLFLAWSLSPECVTGPHAWCGIADVLGRFETTAVVTMFGLLSSVLVFALFVVPAHALNRAFEAVKHPMAHMALNSLLGLAIGASGSIAALALSGVLFFVPYVFPVVFSSAAAAAIALPVAWRVTATRAMTADRGKTPGCAWNFPTAA